jgi:hypothetical protein
MPRPLHDGIERFPLCRHPDMAVAFQHLFETCPAIAMIVMSLAWDSANLVIAVWRRSWKVLCLGVQRVNFPGLELRLFGICRFPLLFNNPKQKCNSLRLHVLNSKSLWRGVSYGLAFEIHAFHEQSSPFLTELGNILLNP